MVIDLGSSSIKAGVCGSERPEKAFPSIVGHVNTKKVANQMGMSPNNNTYIGNSAIQAKSILNLQYPIKNGYVTDWDGLEKLFEHAYDPKYIDFKEHSILLTDPLYNPTSNREKMLQLLFERFETSRVAFVNQQLLSVLANGTSTGIGVDCGENRTCSVPIYDGNILKDSIEILQVGGYHLTEGFGKILQETGKSYTHETNRTIKENNCFVARDFQKATANPNFKKEYKINGYENIELNDIRFRCPEILFQPDLFGVLKDGIHHLINNSINKINPQIRRKCYENIVISGGSSMFEGFEHRLKKEIESLASVNVNITALPERNYLPWKGGSVVSTFSFFQDCYITKKEYEDEGLSVLKKINDFVV